MILFLRWFKEIFLFNFTFVSRFKGFCYVEFDELSDLEAALAMNGFVVVEGNTIKIDVADGKRNDRGGGFDRRGGGRGGSSAPSGGGGFGRRDGRGYGDDFGRKPIYSVERYAQHNVDLI